MSFFDRAKATIFASLAASLEALFRPNRLIL
jgi:hypothetical protein